MEVGHGKGPCDPTGGVSKRNADMAVDTFVYIQDTNVFFAWAKSVDSSIEYCFISNVMYEEN